MEGWQDIMHNKVHNKNIYFFIGLYPISSGALSNLIFYKSVQRYNKNCIYANVSVNPYFFFFVKISMLELFFEKSVKNIWSCQKKAVPLHPLLKKRVIFNKHPRKGIDEKPSTCAVSKSKRRKRNHYTSCTATKSWIAAFDEVR